MTAQDDPARSGSPSRGFPTAPLIGVFVAVFVLGLAFVACGITRSRQQRRRRQMHLNHQAFYQEATHQQEPVHPHLNKPLPGTASVNSFNPRSNQNGFGTTANVYSTYSSGGGPPVYAKEGDTFAQRGDTIIEMPPPAYEPQRAGNV